MERALCFRHDFLLISAMLAFQRNDPSGVRNNDSRASDHGAARTNRANEKYPGSLSISSMTRAHDGPSIHQEASGPQLKVDPPKK